MYVELTASSSSPKCDSLKEMLYLVLKRCTAKQLSAVCLLFPFHVTYIIFVICYNPGSQSPSMLVLETMF